jgi:hypothetical protein
MKKKIANYTQICDFAHHGGRAREDEKKRNPPGEARRIRG